MKFEVSDSTWPGVLKKLDPVLSALFKEGVLMTSIKLGSENRISMINNTVSSSVYSTSTHGILKEILFH